MRDGRRLPVLRLAVTRELRVPDFFVAKSCVWGRRLPGVPLSFVGRVVTL